MHGESVMSCNKLNIFVVIIFLLVSIQSFSKTLDFSNFKWVVRSGFGGAGPNHWSDQNAWVDDKGWLHLRIHKENGTWHSAEIFTEKSFGFGKYYIYVIGRVDQLDPNIVLGFFNYPSSGQFEDGSNEIDIEFSKWGAVEPKASNISYTVWPASIKKSKSTLSYTFQLDGSHSTHGFVWTKNKIYFQSGFGHYADYRYPILSWLFSPPDYKNLIPQTRLPLHLNLWLVNGKAPTDGKPVEVIIKQVVFEPIDSPEYKSDKDKDLCQCTNS